MRPRSQKRPRIRCGLLVSAAAATAVAVAGATTIISWQHSSDPVPAATDPRLYQPRRGDLAGDKALIEQALSIWEVQLPDSPYAGVDRARTVTGRPHRALGT